MHKSVLFIYFLNNLLFTVDWTCCCCLTTDRLYITDFFQLCRDDEYVTLCYTRQTHEDKASRHHGNTTFVLLYRLLLFWR